MALIKLEVEVNAKGEVTKLKQFREEMDKTKQAGESLSSKMKKLVISKKALIAVATIAATTVVALAFAFKKLTEEILIASAALEKGIAEVGTLINKTISEMGVFSNGVMAIMARTGQQTQVLTKGLFDLISAGVESGKALDVLNIAADLATGGSTDVSVAVDGLTSLLNAYVLSADQASDVSDQLFQAQKFGKCFGKGTEVSMYDGDSKKVEDIEVGDAIMGDDNKPRNVLALGKGKEMMYKVTMRDGSSYTVNESHILSLKRNGHFKIDCYKGKKTRKYVNEKVVNISVKDYLKQSKHFKTRYLGYKTNAVKFSERKISIDPYLIGVWLGDGHTDAPRITTMDNEIVEYLVDTAKEKDWKVIKYTMKNNKSSTYSFSRDRKYKGKGSFLEILQKYNLVGNKHVPKDYRINSQENRLKLLAGLIDTDGHCNKTYKTNAYEFSNKNKNLVDDFVWIARSCGFFASVSSKKINNVTYYRVYISGNIDKIPCKIKRKQCASSKNVKRNVLTHGFKIKKLAIADYYGFEIDGNRLFVLNDFNVTHNTTVAELSASIGRLAPITKAAGVSMEEMFAAVATVTKGGISTDETITSLVSTMNSFLKPQEQAVKAAKKLGIELSSNALRVKGLSGVLKELSQAEGTSIDKANLLGVTVRGLKGVLTLVSNDGKEFNKILAEMANRSGVTKIAAEAMRQTFSEQEKILRGKLNVVLIRIGDEILPILTAAIIDLNKWLDKNAHQFDQVGKVIADILPDIISLAATFFKAGIAIAKFFGIIDDRTKLERIKDLRVELKELEVTMLKISLQEGGELFKETTIKNITKVENEIKRLSTTLGDSSKTVEDLKKELDNLGKGTGGVSEVGQELLDKWKQVMLGFEVASADATEKVKIQFRELLKDFKDVAGAREILEKQLSLRLVKIEENRLKKIDKLRKDDLKKLEKLLKGLDKIFDKFTKDNTKNTEDAKKKAEEALKNELNTMKLLVSETNSSLLDIFADTEEGLRNTWIKGASFISVVLEQMVAQAAVAGENIRAALGFGALVGLTAVIGQVSKRRDDDPVSVRVVEDTSALLDLTLKQNRIFSDLQSTLKFQQKLTPKQRLESVLGFAPDFSATTTELNNLDAQIGNVHDAFKEKLQKRIALLAEILERNLETSADFLADQFNLLRDEIERIEKSTANLRKEQERFRESIRADIVGVERAFFTPKEVLIALQNDVIALKDEIAGVEGQARIDKLEELRQAVLSEFGQARDVFASGTPALLNAQQKALDELKKIDEDAAGTFNSLISFEENLLQTMFATKDIQEAQLKLQEIMAEALKKLQAQQFTGGIVTTQPITAQPITTQPISIQAFRDGGVVSSPTIAQVGEVPEAFVPLDNGAIPVRVENRSPNITIVVEHLMARDIGDIVDEINEDNRRRNKGDFADFVVSQNNNLVNLIPATA